MLTHPGPGSGKGFFQLEKHRIETLLRQNAFPSSGCCQGDSFRSCLGREDFWEVSERARDALWEVFLSASEQLFRQLVLRRTLTLSSSQLLNPLLPSPIPALSATLSLQPLFTDLFPEGALTDEDGGFAVASSDKCFLFTDGLNTVEGAHRPPSPALPFVGPLVLRRISKELEGFWVTHEPIL